MTDFYNVQFVLDHTVLTVAIQDDDVKDEAGIIEEAEECLAADGINIRNWSEINIESVETR